MLTAGWCGFQDVEGFVEALRAEYLITPRLAQHFSDDVQET